MKLLLIGSGGREHALAWKLAQSPHVTKMWCAPGNGGIGQERLASNGELVECVTIGAEDLPKLLTFAREKKPDMTVVGPDNPLALGIVDLFQQDGLRIWGPSRKGAQFEASKVFAQQFMERYGIPTARSAAFTEAGAAKEFAKSLAGRCAVKADGLALGKGVLLCRDVAEAFKAIEEVLVRKTFGNAGASIVIQELLEGTELSLHALCDGRTAKLFPTSQDHKRALDGDCGLNTGGMGTYSPTPFLSDTEANEVGRSILEPWLRGCKAEGIDFRGILYPGLMLTKSGPKVLEFNARFGDPETQALLPRMKSGLLRLLEATIDGKTDSCEIEWDKRPSVTVVLASAGYPGKCETGKPILGLSEAGKLEGVHIFHAGTRIANNEIVTSGGRVLAVTALGADIAAARSRAYEAVALIQFERCHYRRDIALRVASG